MGFLECGFGIWIMDYGEANVEGVCICIAMWSRAAPAPANDNALDDGGAERFT